MSQSDEVNVLRIFSMKMLQNAKKQVHEKNIIKTVIL